MVIKNISNNLKKYICLILIVVLCFSLTSCAKVTYAFIFPDKYTIVQQVNVALDTDDIQAHNVDVNDLKNSIKQFADDYINQMQLNFSLNLSSQYFLNSGYATLFQQLKDAVNIYSNWTGNTFVLSIEFSAVRDSNVIYIPVENVYYFYYTGEFIYENEDDETQTEFTKELFISIYKQTSSTSFDSSLSEYIEEYFMGKYGVYGYTINDVAMVYKYGQAYSRLHSDADNVSYSDGVYVHTWNLSDKDQQITLYRVYANPVAWYVLAIIIGVVIALVLFIIGIVLKKHKLKSKQDSTIPNIEGNGL